MGMYKKLSIIFLGKLFRGGGGGGGGGGAMFQEIEEGS